MSLLPNTDVLNIEKNFYQLYSEFGRIPLLTFKETDDFSWIWSKPSPWPNIIFKIQLKYPLECIKDIVGRIRETVLPPSILIGPSTIPNNLGKYLLEFGFLKTTELTGMEMWLKTYTRKESAKGLILIEDIKEKQQLKSWRKILFRIDTNETQVFDNILTEWNVMNKDYVGLQIASMGQEVVGASMWLITDSAVGIYWVHVKNKARRQGIGTALTRAAIQKGIERGCHKAVLQSTPMGCKMYEIMGFKPCCKFEVFTFDQ